MVSTEFRWLIIGTVSGCCENNTEHPSSIKVGGILGQLGHYQVILLGLSPFWHRKNADVIIKQI